MRILIVEDDEAMVIMIRRLLNAASKQLDSTDDIREALVMAKENRYHIIILDLRLAKTNKAESLAAIRELKSNNSAVVVVSGLIENGIRDEALAAGADQFVPKAANAFSQALLMACHIAILHLPHEAFHGESISEQITILKNLAYA